MSYVSLADLKVYLGIPSAETSDDALLTTLLASAQQAVDTHCRRTFEWSGAAVARYFHAIDDVRDRRLWLDKDCAAVSAVVNGDGDTVDSADYILEPRNYAADGESIRSILLRADSGISWTYEDEPEGAIAVTGKWAYSLAAPDDIVQATTRLAGYLYRQKDNAGDLEQLAFANQGSINLPAKLPSDVALLLASYIKRVIVH